MVLALSLLVRIFVLKNQFPILMRFGRFSTISLIAILLFQNTLIKKLRSILSLILSSMSIGSRAWTHTHQLLLRSEGFIRISIEVLKRLSKIKEFSPIYGARLLLLAKVEIIFLGPTRTDLWFVR